MLRQPIPLPISPFSEEELTPGPNRWRAEDPAGEAVIDSLTKGLIANPQGFFEDKDLVKQLLHLEEKDRIQIAKVVATQNRDFSYYIQNYEIKDQSVLIEIAKISAAHYGQTTSAFIQHYGITDQNALIEIAKISVAQDAWHTSEFIQNYGIEDGNVLIEIAKIAVAEDGGRVSMVIQNYGFTDQDVLVELAKIAVAQNTWITSAHIQKYGITDQKALIEIAKIGAAENGEGISEGIHNYGISSQKALIEIAKIAAAQDGGGTSDGIKNYGIKNKKALIEIAKIAAAQDGGGVSQCIQNYGIKDQNTLVEIAKIAVAQNAWGSFVQIQNYGIKDDNALIDIAKIAIRADVAVLSRLSEFGLSLSSILSEIISEEITAFTPNFNFAGFLQDLAGSPRLLAEEPDPDYHDWDEKPPREKALWVAVKIKELCPQLDETFFDYAQEVQSEASVYNAIAATLYTWDKIVPNGHNRSRLALQEICGLANIPLQELSQNSRTALYETIFAAQQTSPSPLGAFLKIDEDSWIENFTTTLSLVTQSAACRGLGVEEEPLKELSDKPLNERLKETKKLLSDTFKETFSLSSGDGVDRLIEQWGTIEPLMVLFSRYKNNPSTEWQNEISILKQIIENTLKGRFHEWKYSHSQNEVFTPEQFTLWQKNPSSLELHSVGSEQIDYRKKTRQIFNTNILHNLPSEVVKALESTQFLLPDTLHLTGKEFNRQFSSLTEVLGALNVLLTEGTEEELKSFLKLFMSCKARFFKELEPTVKEQLDNDLRSLNECLNPKTTQAGRGYLVFNIITDDPKLLLTVGDLVKVSSCQNYRTGQYVQTLPGYVMDANIKVALSYVIPLARLQGEFKGVPFSFEDISYSFNAPKQELTFSLGNSSVCIPLGSATSRRILRVGQDEEQEASLLVEQAYSQNHAIEAQINSSLSALIDAFRKSSLLNAVSGKMSFPASSNPSGVYSDAAGGIRKDSYKISI